MTNPIEEVKMSLAFYTYFYGDADNPAFKIPEIPSLKYKCYYYTDNPHLLKLLEDSLWIGVYDTSYIAKDPDGKLRGDFPIRLFPEEYEELKDYSYLCSFDSKYDVGLIMHEHARTKVDEKFVEDYIFTYFIKQNYALLLREHWDGYSGVWDEYKASMDQERYRNESDRLVNYINRQISMGFSDVAEQWCATGFVIRNMKHKKTKLINSIWHEHMQECGAQGQISFFFVKQLFEESIHSFTELPFIRDEQNLID